MFEGKPTVIDGIEIPYDGPVFLVLLSIHVLAGLTCVVSGAIAMLSPKKKGRHTKTGNIYYWAIWVVFITATLIALARWKEDYHIFILGTGSFFAAFFGRRAEKKHWPKWTLYHISGMGISYIFLLMAFYVDNGRFLPVWKDINPVLYWALPLLIGMAILVRVLLTNPMSRNYFKR